MGALSVTLDIIRSTALPVHLVHLAVCVLIALQSCYAILAPSRPWDQHFVLNAQLALRAVPPVNRMTELSVHLDHLQSKGRHSVLSAQLVISVMTRQRILEFYAQREHLQVQGRLLAGRVRLVSFVLMAKLEHVHLERFP
jgi:hypothetical protein